ncbi:MAG: endonuclease/exonuclease/phosphatase family protein [Methyloceanibacter sp.]|nr:endonuclease/exonuclease/phosphatase family protein [Methyloceanibacter sp.]
MVEVLRDAQRAHRARVEAAAPYVSLVRAASKSTAMPQQLPARMRVATYNVHRWSGASGRQVPDATRTGIVISELNADVVALQEVLRPFDAKDPLTELAEAQHLHVAFVVTRAHRRGELGNAILSRWPITSLFVLDLSFSRLERRSALAAEFKLGDRSLTVVATHLALRDRTRQRQVRTILSHPQLQGPVVLMGDLNAWRRSKATRALEAALGVHGNRRWPASFPSVRPILALDRIYSRGAQIETLEVHRSLEARRASDHLPVIAGLKLPVMANQTLTPSSF